MSSRNTDIHKRHLVYIEARLSDIAIRQITKIFKTRH